MNRKLLFLAAPFPPSTRVGSIRAGNVAKYLAKRGWSVTVATVKPSLLGQTTFLGNRDTTLTGLSIKCLYTDHDYRFLQSGFIHSRFDEWAPSTSRLMRWGVRSLGIDLGIGWKGPLLRACEEMQASDTDIILATGSPFASFEAAEEISRKLGCPFVLDYRDLWTNNPHNNIPSPSWAKKREERILAQSSAVFVVSPFMASVLEREFGCKNKTHVITNGFDPEELNSVPTLPLEGHSMVYTGRFYPPKRIVDPIFSALSVLNSQSSSYAKNLKFHYYGPDGNYCMKRACYFNVKHMVVTHGVVDRNVSLSAIKSADIAIVITTVGSFGSDEEKGIITGKLFEPLGLGTPILLVAPEGNDARAIVKKTGAGRSFTGDQVSEIAAFIDDFFAGTIKWTRGDPDEYSWPRIIKDLDVILASCLIAS